MNDVEEMYARPGDIIRLKPAVGVMGGEEHVVVSPPKTTTHAPVMGDAWITYRKSGRSVFIPFQYYILIGNAKQSPQPVTPKNVDAFLKQQMNDNLSGVFT